MPLRTRLRRKKAEPHRRPLTDQYCRITNESMTWDTLQPGLCLRVRQRRTLYVVYRYDGRPRWYRIGRFGAIGLKEARETARKILGKAVLGEDPQEEKIKARREARLGDTLAQVHERYLAIEARPKNKSWQQADNLMRRYVLPSLGKRKLRDITNQDIWQLFDGLHNRPVLANSVLTSASAVFRFALKRRIISDNPCRGISHHKPSPKKRFLSDDEIRLVWPLFDDLGLYQSYALKLVLILAQRPGEVCAMRWEHVDNDLWTMPGEASATWPGTKNKRDHEVPLTEPALAILAELGPATRGPVFPSARRGSIGIPPTRAIWAKASIERFRPHDLRATAATGMDRLGVSREHISLVLNHVEGGTTAGYIRHDKRSHKRRALQKWAKELAKLCGI